MTLPTRINTKRRAEIIEATIAALNETGYAGTSLAEIGQRVGISKSVVGYHFKNKDALIDAVIDAIYDKGFEVVRPPIDAEPTAFGKIRTFIRQSIYFYDQYATHVVALSRLRLYLTNASEPNTTMTNRLHQELSDLSAIFREGQTSGEFRHFDVHIMARTLRQALDGVLVEMTHHPDSNIDHYADELVNLFNYATKK
jgi:TetR/AcrR family transcriptional regulator, fatty acid metabolism regulator protein